MTRQLHTLDQWTTGEIEDRVNRFVRAYPNFTAGRVLVRMSPDVASAIETEAVARRRRVGPLDVSWHLDPEVPEGMIWIEHQ